MESDSAKLSLFPLQASNMSNSTVSNTPSESSGKKISKLSFDPTKIRKIVVPRDDSERDSYMDENCSREGLLCQLCGETYSTQRSLDLHMRLHAAKEMRHTPEKPRFFQDNTEFDDTEVDGSTPRRVHKPREKKYECSICQKRFSTKDNIRSHMKIHSGETPFQCPLCVKRFAHGRNLHRHMIISHKEHDANEARELCTKLMQQINSHENRMVVYTGEKPKPYKCGICSKTFRRLYRVKSHTRSHTGQKPFQCSVCSKLFSSSEILYRHVKRLHSAGASATKSRKPKVEEVVEPETEKEPDYGGHTTIIQIDDGSGSTYSIPVQQNSANELTFLHTPRQGEVYTVNGENADGNGPTYYIDLRTSQFTPAQHMEVQMVQEQPEQLQPQLELEHHLPDHDEGGNDDYHHNDPHDELLGQSTAPSPEKAFQCSLCRETFETGPALNRHISTHKFQLPSKCYICGKVFKQESYLKRHMIVHSEERPFKCSLCPKAFKRQYRLSNHWRTHTGERPYNCSICNKAFAVSDNLYKHIKKIHKGAGIESASNLVKQLQEMNREKKYALLYGDLEVIEEQSI